MSSRKKVDHGDTSSAAIEGLEVATCTNQHMAVPLVAIRLIPHSTVSLVLREHSSNAEANVMIRVEQGGVAIACEGEELCTERLLCLLGLYTPDGVLQVLVHLQIESKEQEQK